MIGPVFQKVVYGYLRKLPRNRKFVFGIGLSKTGTTSLNDALCMLGYKSIHLPPITHVNDQGQIEMRWPWWVSKFDAATDLTVAVLFRELKESFPNSKFIYTSRDKDAWLASCERHFSLDLAEKRIDQKNLFLLELTRSFYGSIVFDKDLYLRAFEEHEAAVRSFFRNDRNFFELRLTERPEWPELCDFLGRPVPEVDFPHANRSRARVSEG